MRYYIYLDRDLLRILFSVIADSNFDIEVVEYTLRKSYTTNNGISVDPSMESIRQDEIMCRNDPLKESTESQRNEKLKKERLGFNYDYGNSYNVQTERRYLNIEDITNMKNTHFYHELLEKMRNTYRSDESRIVEEIGYIKVDRRNRESRINSSNPNDLFFMVNDTFVWIDSRKLQGDLELLCDMSCKINVIGYMMNCKESEGSKIIKAVAIFIE